MLIILGTKGEIGMIRMNINFQNPISEVGSIHVVGANYLSFPWGVMHLYPPAELSSELGFCGYLEGWQSRT